MTKAERELLMLLCRDRLNEWTDWEYVPSRGERRTLLLEQIQALADEDAAKALADKDATPVGNPREKD